MNKAFKEFETDRLKLIPTSLEDAAYVLKIMNTPKWHQYIGDRGIHTLTDASTYIKNHMLPLLERRGFSNYTMILKSNGEKIGSCGLYDREKIEGIDIGFALLPEYERKGYGFEAATKILETARDVFNISKLSAITTTANKASQLLIEKLGMTYKETIKWDHEELMLYVIHF